MAKKPIPSASRDDRAGVSIPDDEHPDYSPGTVGENVDPEGFDQFTPNPDSGPLPGPIPPMRVPWRPPIVPPLRPPGWFCAAVSGRYRSLRRTSGVPRPRRPGLPIRPQPIAPPLIPPPGLMVIAARVDVDRFFPQHRISVEVSRSFPRASAHVIAEVTSDRCLGLNNRVVEATITYREGTSSLLPGDTLVFRAARGNGFGYSNYTLSMLSGGTVARSFQMQFVSRFFDSVEFEVDQVANADAPTTSYHTAAHPNRPADLPEETLALETIYRRAGFDACRSPNISSIPTADAGANSTWSDSEMHDAMATYWSRFADKSAWALWVLFAKRHDQGRSLGGIMFDDIGANHRQGTAIFTDSFIQDAPGDDADPAAWRQRMVFWTAIHEMGHAFNLAHAWQKALGNPWIPLANEPESRSFMNYPFRVADGESAFFEDFRFRFSDDELIFMRHAPRRFVQMGNEDWFENHAFEDGALLSGPARNWQLEVRPNREMNNYRFLEPVFLELKLTNTSDGRVVVEEDLLRDGRHSSILVRRDGGKTKKWRAFATHCHRTDQKTLRKGESIYGSHLVGASTDGWLIDEPGSYLIQAAVTVGSEVVVSNVLRLLVEIPASEAEKTVAPDYFSEDVGRVLAFKGAPSLTEANETLLRVIEECSSNPAATHATVALESTKLRRYKTLGVDAGKRDMVLRSTKAEPRSGLEAMRVLLDSSDESAETLGHIRYFEMLNELVDSLEKENEPEIAANVQEQSLAVMKKRDILGSVVSSAERKLKGMR